MRNIYHTLKKQLTPCIYHGEPKNFAMHAGMPVGKNSCAACTINFAVRRIDDVIDQCKSLLHTATYEIT